jgi:tetratricopeptide (TPR) repeat protein
MLRAMVSRVREEPQGSGAKAPADASRLRRARGGNPHVAGNPVGGSAAFVGREDVVRAVVRALGEPKNQGIVLYGQRRIGKTSILQHLVAILPERTGHVPVYFDLQDKAAESLASVLSDLAGDIAAALSLPDPSPSLDVEAWFRDEWLPRVLAGLPDDVSLVLLFDEFDVLADVEAKQAATALFPYLRRLLERNSPRLRVVFVIGRNLDDLENVAHSLFKGMPSCQVSLLSREDSERLIRLSETTGALRWSDEAVATAWALTHGHPLLLQALCSHVWAGAHEGDTARPTGVADVNAAAELSLGTTRSAFEWLWKGLPPGKRVVAAALAKAGPEAIFEEDLHRILHENGVRVIIRELRDAPRMLIEWDLLEEPAPGQYQFRVELLRRLISRYKPLARVQEDLDQLDPTAELLYRTGEAYYRKGDLDTATARLQEAVALNPNHVRASELLADILISRKDWLGARRLLEPLYETQPAVARARLVQVMVAQAEVAVQESERLDLYMSIGKIERSQTAVEGIRRIWRERGHRARDAGNLAAAIDAYRAGGLEDLAADADRELRRSLASKSLQEAQELERRGAYDEARERVRKLADKYGDVLDFQRYVDHIDESVELEALYGRAIEYGVAHAEALGLLARIVGRRHDFKDALDLLYHGADYSLLRVVGLLMLSCRPERAKEN